VRNRYNFENIGIDVLHNKLRLFEKNEILFLGVGGAGFNIIEKFVEMGYNGANLAFADTDYAAIATSKSPYKKELGEKVANYKDTGNDIELGKKACLESYDDLIELLTPYKIVFIYAGLGGGLGSSAVIEIGKIAKKLDIFSLALVTTPFDFEINRKIISQKILTELRENVDSYIVINNNFISDDNIQDKSMIDTFDFMNKKICDIGKSICDLIIYYQNDNLTLHNFVGNTIDKGELFFDMRKSNSKGLDKGWSTLLFEKVIESLKIDDIAENTHKKGVMITIKYHSNFPADEIISLLGYFKDESNSLNDTLYGTIFDDEMKEDEIEIITIIQ